MPQFTSKLIEKGKICHEERKTASHITKCLKMKVEKRRWAFIALPQNVENIEGAFGKLTLK